MYQMCGARPLYETSIYALFGINNVNFAYPKVDYAVPASAINLK
jgi:hypothetical protein